MFVRWIIGQAQRASQQREEMRMRKRRERRYSETPRASVRPGYEQPTQRPQTHTQTEPTTISIQNVPETIQDLIELRRQTILREQQEAAAVSAKPPPLPPSTGGVAEAVPRDVPTAPDPTQSTKSSDLGGLPIGTKSAKKKRDSSLVEALHDPKQVRNAILLREILGKPKSLKM